jgi:hypothetical protein
MRERERSRAAAIYRDEIDGRFILSILDQQHFLFFFNTFDNKTREGAAAADTHEGIYIRDELAVSLQIEHGDYISLMAIKSSVAQS